MYYICYKEYKHDIFGKILNNEVFFTLLNSPMIVMDFMLGPISMIFN